MKKNLATETIGIIRMHLAYLFDEYDCKISYLTVDYGYHWFGILLELSSHRLNYNFKLSREEYTAPVRIDIGAQEKYPGWKWVYLPTVIYHLSGKRQKREPDNPAKDLEEQIRYIKPYLDEINALFKKPMHFEEWVQTQTSLRKQMVTVEKVRAERARLQALGLDSSVDAALKNLRGKYDA